MNDMENKNPMDFEEDNAPKKEGALPSDSESGTTGEKSYEYQPPIGRGDGMQGQPQPNPYGGYQFGQQPQGQPGQSPYGQPIPDDRWNYPQYETTTPPKRPKKKGAGLKIFAGIMGGLLGIAVISFAVFGAYNLFVEHPNSLIDQDPQSQSDTVINNDVPELQSASKPSDNTVSSADGVLTTSQVNQKVAPSVVGIVQYQSSYFEPTSEGSGIILSENGYIATNFHVIDGADSLEVVLSDGTTYKGTVVGYDSKTDLAVIKIDATGLTPADLGVSGELKVGEKAIAIGNPGGLSYAGSVSEGIISGLNRSLRAATDGYTLNFIQTDAAISPGNSGGALVNEFGQVVGINTQKLAADGYEGIGFAIPIDEALPILKDLMSYGRVTGRVKLGISAYALNEYAASVNGIPSGILIDTVDQDSTLNAAGVQAGDIITKIDGTAVASFTSLSDLLRGYKPGDKVTLTIFRANQTQGGSNRYNYAQGGQTIQGTSFDVQVTLMEDTGSVVANQNN